MFFSHIFSPDSEDILKAVPSLVLLCSRFDQQLLALQRCPTLSFPIDLKAMQLLSPPNETPVMVDP